MKNSIEDKIKDFINDIIKNKIKRSTRNKIKNYTENKIKNNTKILYILTSMVFFENDIYIMGMSKFDHYKKNIQYYNKKYNMEFECVHLEKCDNIMLKITIKKLLTKYRTRTETINSVNMYQISLVNIMNTIKKSKDIIKKSR